MFFGVLGGSPSTVIYTYSGGYELFPEGRRPSKFADLVNTFRFAPVSSNLVVRTSSYDRLRFREHPLLNIFLSHPLNRPLNLSLNLPLNLPLPSYVIMSRMRG